MDRGKIMNYPDPRQQQWPPQPPQYGQQPQQQWPPQQGYGQQVQPYQQPPLYASSLYGPQQPPMAVAPKSPTVGLLLGLLLPGLGCMTSGRPGLGILILASWLVSLVLILILIGWLLAPACWIWSGVAGYVTTRDWNRDRGIIS